MRMLESIHGAYMKTISTDNAPKAIGTYSQAVHHHHFVFTSGQIPLNPETGALVVGDFKAEVLQVLNNLDKLDEIIKNIIIGIYISGENDNEE